MLIRMRQLAAGPDGVLYQGREYDLADERAVPLIAAGAAVPVRSPAIERAVVEPDGELAVLSPPARKRGRPRKVNP